MAICKTCRETYPDDVSGQKAHAKKHILSFGLLKGYQCIVCNNWFRRENEAIKHVRDLHM